MTIGGITRQGADNPEGSRQEGKPKQMTRGVLLVLLIIAILAPCWAATGEMEKLFLSAKVQFLSSKNKAPEFSLEGLSGRRADLKQFKDKVVLLTFWATWCGPCKEEMPSLEALHQEFQGKDFTILTVSVDAEGAIPVEKFIARRGYTFYVLLDPKGTLLDLYRVEAIPTSFLLDKKGRVIGKALGARNWKSPEAISLVTRLIEEKNR
jgi:peroxiredoxin